MTSIFEAGGFTCLDNDYRDLEIYRRDDVLLVGMIKFKGDKKAFRQASNHLDERLIAELLAVLDRYRQDSTVKAVILSSNHKVAFSRGAKIELLQGASRDFCHKFIDYGQSLLLAIQRYPKPVIAAITGLILGGGLELALACDYRICSSRENVVFGLPEVSLGIIPAMGGTQNLARVIGREAAFRIITEARADIFAAEALRLGIVDAVAAPAELVKKAFGRACRGDLKKAYPVPPVEPGVTTVQIQTEIDEYLARAEIKVIPGAKAAPLARALAGFIFAKTAPDNYLAALQYEKEVLCYLQQTADCREGLAALAEERPAVFTGS